jgi:hypothetical protein
LAKIHSKFLVAFVCTATMSILAQAGFAQGPTSQDVDRAQLLQDQTQPSFGTSTTSEGIQDGHAAKSPNDADIGEQEILKRTTEYRPLYVALATPIFYTSNVALTRSGEMSDVVIAPMAAMYYQPQITKTLYGNFGAREQVFYYGSNHAFDFGSLDVEAGLNYFMPQFHNLILRAEYDFNRLTFDDRLGDEFFSNHGLIFNAELPFRFSRAQQLAIGVNTNISVAADHQSPRRNDYEGYVAYSVNLTRAFSVNAAGRVVARDYHQNGRTDVSEILSASATYRLTDWCSISAISSFAHSDSNKDVFDYNVANVGGAIALSARF